MVALGLAVLLGGLSLFALQPSRHKAPVKGLASALAEEFEAARQMSIANGRPVALAIPTNDGSSPNSSSVYRLEGWNRPLVTAVRDYRGDYPHVVFMAAKWAGPNFTEGLAPSALSKYSGFVLDEWLPEANKKDSIFCFTPDGGLVTNALPATGGRYTVVVVQNPNVGGSGPNNWTIQGGEAAFTLLISPGGGVDQAVGLPGGTLGPAGSDVARAPAKSLTKFGGAGANVRISEITVRPNPDEAPPDQGTCVPGQVVTLEVYAYDPQGRALFSKWTQEAEDPKLPSGHFSYPYSATNPDLKGEVDKMEFVYDIPSDVQWVGGMAPPDGVGAFRARWNWTVPVTSQPGDRYRVQADVRDVKGEVYIENPPKKVFKTPPTGKLLVERLGPDGLWQLVLMNPDGSGEKVLSAPGVEESMPSLDSSGTKMAFLQGTLPSRYVKVRNLHGGPEQILTPAAGAYTSVSMSPDGAWVSYRNNGNGRLYTKKLDGSVTHDKEQSFSGSGHGIRKSRSGWSQNGRFMLYEHDGLIYSLNLANGNAISLLSKPFHNQIVGIYDGSETPYAPISYRAEDGGDRVLVSLGGNNPVLVSFPVSEAEYSSGGIDPGVIGNGTLSNYSKGTHGKYLQVDYGGNDGILGSGTDNDYPSISSDGRQLIWTRSPQSSVDGTGAPEDIVGQELRIVPRKGDNFIQDPGGAIKVSQKDVRRAVWIPAQQ